jgi:hypothetical protein
MDYIPWIFSDLLLWLLMDVKEPETPSKSTVKGNSNA